jgi:hypothetical protein
LNIQPIFAIISISIRMKFIFRLFLLVAFIACIAYYSKPNNDLVREKVAQHVLGKSQNEDPASTIGFIAEGLAKLVATKSLKIEDKILYKKVTLIGSNEKGIGAFGTVFFY